MRVFEILLNIYTWIRIFLSPVSIAMVIGYITSYNMGGFYGKLAWILIVATGAAIGIGFAETVRRKARDSYYTDAINSQDHPIEADKKNQ